jgi:hypothetical protein
VGIKIGVKSRQVVRVASDRVYYRSVENFLRVRFGELDEELSEAIALMLQLPTEELTRLLLTCFPLRSS